MKDEQELREIFLKEFVLELVLNSMHYHRPRHTIRHAKKIPLEIKKEVIEQLADIKKIEPVLEEKKEDSVKQSLLELQPAKPVQIIRPAPVPAIMPRLAPQQVMPPAQPAIPQGVKIAPPVIPSVNIGQLTPQNLRLFGFEKLIHLILDPSILSIECPGPRKPIIINRAHMTETTNIMLTSEEINLIMKNLSDKTRIPLITGTFKVAFGNFIITAVISEFAGTRFLMQRRTLMAPPLQI